jgi:hypothetical protein
VPAPLAAAVPLQQLHLLLLGLRAAPPRLQVRQAASVSTLWQLLLLEVLL